MVEPYAAHPPLNHGCYSYGSTNACYFARCLDTPQGASAFAKTTIRELLRWTDAVAPRLATAPAPGGAALAQLLSEAAYVVYVSRLRSDEAQAALVRALPDADHVSQLFMSGSGHGLEVILHALFGNSCTSTSNPQHGASEAQPSEEERAALLSAAASAREAAAARIAAAGAAADGNLPSQNQQAGLVEALALLGQEVVMEGALVAHVTARTLMRKPAFLRAYGAYRAPGRPLWQQWVEEGTAAAAARAGALARSSGADCGINQAAVLASFFDAGLKLYARQLRGKTARQELVSVFSDALVSACSAACPLDVAESGVPPLSIEALAAEPGAQKPFAITARVLRNWSLMLPAFAAAEPLLVTGADGCGKSSCLRALAHLTTALQYINLTPGRPPKAFCRASVIGVLPTVLARATDIFHLLTIQSPAAPLPTESEPSELIGQYLPVDGAAASTAAADDNGGGSIRWFDGAATRACRDGCSLLVDNLGAAEATVLERLNPLLERPPVLVLTERGDAELLAVQPGFRFMATLTPPPQRHGGATGVAGAGEELSPALVNRLSVVHLPDVMDAFEPHFAAEVQQICAVLCGGSDGVRWSADGPQADAALGAELCVLLRRQLRGGQASSLAAALGPATLTLGVLVRLMDLAYALTLRHRVCFAQALWLAYSATLGGSVLSNNAGSISASGGMQAPDAVTAAVRELLLSKLPAGERHLLDPGMLLFGMASEAAVATAGAAGATAAAEPLVLHHHVLTPSRCAHAAALVTCLEAGQAVLLEGPAAVGKTSLVAELARARDKMVFRVNNSESTSMQDYLGTFLPSSGGGEEGAGSSCTFREGPLLQALRQGAWFLADELNLAQAGVLSLLAPLLEGLGFVQVPGTDRVVAAAPGFCFVATQNAARGGYAGRQPLPSALRSRMVEVQVPDFAREELPEIILRRSELLATTAGGVCNRCVHLALDTRIRHTVPFVSTAPEV